MECRPRFVQSALLRTPVSSGPVLCVIGRFGHREAPRVCDAGGALGFPIGLSSPQIFVTHPAVDSAAEIATGFQILGTAILH